MEEILILNKTNNEKTFKVNPEKPYFKINKLSIPSIPVNSNNIVSLAPKFIIRAKVTDIHGNQNTKVIDGVLPYITASHREAVFDINYTLVFDPSHQSIQIEFENKDEKDEDIVLHYTRFNQSVDLVNPFKQFQSEFEDVKNVKILFSAPFGQGKTTFLNYYFNNHKDTYEVFRLYPVNYAISHNDDIFKYIKAELLFQLLGKDVEFDKQKFDYLDTAPGFFQKNAIKILAPFLSSIPKIGKSASSIYEKFHQLAKDYLDYHKKKQVDDKAEAISFIQELYEVEGSIFEDNFYTQLIRQLLEQHKLKHKRNNVLIIDDIDRMDPDHVFRIFNVFSANFDSIDHLELSNKFGFDKIILVCDYVNIKNLFIHRYGSSYSFNGYLSKYYSKSPFYYDNTAAMESLVEEVVYGARRKGNATNVGEILSNLLKGLIFKNEITLRELLQLNGSSYYDTLNKLSRLYSNKFQTHKHKFVYFVIIAFLEKIFDTDVLTEKIKRSRSLLMFNQRINYNFYCLVGLPALGEFINFREDMRYLNLNGNTIKYSITESTDRFNLSSDYFEAKDIVNVSNQAQSFNENDFYNIFLLNIEKYKEF